MFRIVTAYATDLSDAPLRRLSDCIDIHVAPIRDDSATARDLLTHYHLFDAARKLTLDVPSVLQIPNVRTVLLAGRRTRAITVHLTGRADALSAAEDALRAHLATLYGDQFVAYHRISGKTGDRYPEMNHEWATPSGDIVPLIPTPIPSPS